MTIEYAMHAWKHPRTRFQLCTAWLLAGWTIAHVWVSSAAMAQQTGQAIVEQQRAEAPSEALRPDTLGAAGHGQIVLQSALTRIVERVDLSAVQSGVLAELFVREGHVVAQGDLLGKVDDTILRLRFERTKLEANVAEREASNDVQIRLARKTLELAQTEYERALGLNSKIPDSVSQREINALRLAREKAELEIEAAEHEHQLAQLAYRQLQADVDIAAAELSRTQLIAPMDGMVVHVDKRAGEWVDAGSMVIRIVRVDRVRAEGFVTSAEAALGLQGCRATLVTDATASTAREFIGEVVFVDPEANAVDRRVRVWADFDNSEGKLRPGLPVQVLIQRPTAAE